MSSVVVVGIFDGLHRGHDAILDRALQAGRRRGLECVVVSFDPHPDLVLSRSFQAVLPLTPIPEKRERLMRRGVDRLEVIPFTRELAGLEPETFVRDDLLTPFDMKVLVVGEDFALGRGRSGNVARLRDIGAASGFEVEPVPLLRLDGEIVSSTRIRELLGAGKVKDAARLLGRDYDLAGRVVRGEAIGRRLGFPTANLRLHEEKFLPRDGVYAARVRVGDDEARRPAAVSIGERPTFDGLARAIEAYLLDWSDDVLGRDLTLELAEWIRPQEKFADIGKLVDAMQQDVIDVRRILGATLPVHEPEGRG